MAHRPRPPMILNPPSVAAALLTLVEGWLAVTVAVRSALALRALARARTEVERDAAEVGALRPALSAGVLSVVVLASWALLIEVLASYVPTWPSVICIEGVTRIGQDSVGAARWLPRLLDVLFATKPALVLLGAAWCGVHAVSRRSGARPGRAGPVLLLALGVLAALDAAAELAYLVIPKAARTLSAGCCQITSLVLENVVPTPLERLTGGLIEDTVVPWAALAGAALLALIGALCSSRLRRPPLRHALAWAALPAATLTWLTARHVVVAEIGPRVTGISTHRCGWCVLRDQPWLGAGIGLLAVACLLVPVSVLLTGLEKRAEAAGTGVGRAVARAVAGLLLAAAACAAAASI